MPLSTRISNNLIIDSNLIETSVEEEEEGENDQNEVVSNEEGSDSIPLTPTTPSSRQTRLARLFQERRRIVGRTVSESQLLAKPIANGTEKSKEAEDTPDFYEHRAKGEENIHTLHFTHALFMLHDITLYAFSFVSNIIKKLQIIPSFIRGKYGA